MATKLPENARTMRQMLAQYLTSCKAYMVSNSDKIWIQGEIDRFKEQINMLTQGVKSVKKATGITRKIDDLGRLVVPKELRTTLGIGEGDPMEIFFDDENHQIVLQKYEPACHFCGHNFDDITMFRGRRICESCLAELYNHTAN